MADGEARPIVHSERGAHYSWPGWLMKIADAKLVRSMSRKACSLAKYLPEVVNSAHVNQARQLTLKSMQPLAPDLLTDEKLAKIDDELSKVPAPTQQSAQ